LDQRILQFVAIVLTALATVPGGAHLLALANKIGLYREHYLTVQAIYRGWAFLGVILIASIVANGLVEVMAREQRWPMVLSAGAARLMVTTLAIFFIWTFPANQATENWSMAPENWRTLRAQWEYSHAVNSALTFLALCAATASALLYPTTPTGG
jgi:hypothetical protein